MHNFLKYFSSFLFTLLFILRPATIGAEERRVRKPLPSAAEIAKLPKDGGKEFNRLVHETSPYLMQHARNPVDWRPWGPEAFKVAKELDKPIFLSVGYSSCHWCHVMEHESFENEDVAKIMNEHYVCVKVDREERPDVDQIYMTATHLLTRRGGWPNSVWMTPDGRPFFAGTYYPPPQFTQILEGLGKTWKEKREDVETQATRISDHIKKSMESTEMRTPVELSGISLKAAVDNYQRDFDDRLGGFGKAPKFPPHAKLRFLLKYHAETKDEKALQMVTHTLDQMAMGGMYDHVGGGFHRYSTDAKWFLPHFEKMLYDNGQLAWVYAEAYRVTQKPFYKDTLTRMLGWVDRIMTDSKGGFYSALDADSEGIEAIYYIWSEEELKEILGEEEAKLFAKVYNCIASGNYFDQATRKASGSNIPHLSASFADTAKAEKIPLADLEKRLAASRAKLLAVRQKRIPPGLDDKVLTAWNGLMISGLAHAGRQLEEPQYIKSAARAADFILANMYKNGRLLRSYRNGESRLNAYLDDYAFLADGLLDLYGATQNKKWLDASEKLLATLIEYYEDRENGGFFFTAHDHEELLARNLEPFDNATPAGNAVAIRMITRLAQLTGKDAYYNLAEKNLKIFGSQIERIPGASGTLMETLMLFNKLSKPASASIAKADAQAQKAPVKLELYASQTKGAPGSTVEILVRLEVDAKWHINANKPLEDYLIPTSLGLEKSAGLTLDNVVYPKPEIVKLGGFPNKLAIYEGSFDIRGQLQISKDAKAGKTELTFQVESQACDDQSCLRPETHVLKIPFEVTAAGEKATKRHPALFKD